MEKGGGGLAGISPCLWSLLSQAGNVCAGCQCASDQALHTDLLPGNAAGLRDRRHTQDSDAAEKSSLLHLNRGRHAGTGGSRRIGWMLKHSWNVHYEFWMWFVEARMWPESGRTKTFFFFLITGVERRPHSVRIHRDTFPININTAGIRELAKAKTTS